MWLFWIVAGALAAATAAVVVARPRCAAAKVRRRGQVEDPTLPVYRRQLAEIDDLASRGLLGQDEQRAAHADAGAGRLSPGRRGLGQRAPEQRRRARAAP